MPSNKQEITNQSQVFPQVHEATFWRLGGDKPMREEIKKKKKTKKTWHEKHWRADQQKTVKHAELHHSAFFSKALFSRSRLRII